MKQTSLTHKLSTLLLCLLVAAIAFSQDTNRVLAHSQNQQYIVMCDSCTYYSLYPRSRVYKGKFETLSLDSLRQRKISKVLYQRHYTYKQLKRLGYNPTYYKGSRCMTWKWYIELTK